MRKMNWGVAVALVAAAIQTPAMAENFYGALDIGQTRAGDACNVTGLPAGSTVAGCNDTATMYRIAGGYQFTRMWGAEVSYGYYGKASLGTVTVPGFGTIAGGDWKLDGVQVAGTGTFYLGKAFAVIAKVGAARTDLKLTAASLSASKTNLFYGLGAQYDFTRSFAVRAQYEDLGKVGDPNTTGEAKVSILSAGIVVRF